MPTELDNPHFLLIISY